MIPLHINPANPAGAEPARGTDLWASPGFLGIFLAFLVGPFVLLWRVKQPRIEIPSAPFRPRDPKFETRFARGEAPRSAQSEIVMRQPRQAWKANPCWAILPSILAVAGVDGIAESPWIAVVMVLLGLAGAGWLVKQAVHNHSYILRCDSRRMVVRDRFGSATVELFDIARAQRWQGAQGGHESLPVFGGAGTAAAGAGPGARGGGVEEQLRRLGGAPAP